MTLEAITKPVQLKDKTKKSSKLWRWFRGTWVYENVHDFFCNLRRSFDYARFGWSNYDFDNGYVLRLLSFKLKRLQRVMTNGHLTHDKPTTQSLSLTIRLLDRLVEENYNYFLDRHNKKWYGTKYPECTFEQLPDADASRMIWPSEKLPEDQREQEHAEHMRAIRRDEKIKARDKTLVFAIMEKYYEYWWD